MEDKREPSVGYDFSQLDYNHSALLIFTITTPN
jgi:hypothetical protein